MIRVLELLGPSAGGIRRHVAVLSQLLSAGGDSVVTAGPDGVMDGLDLGGSEFRAVAVPSSFHPKRILAAVRALRSMRGEFDIVHAHGLKAAWVAVLSGPGVPVVLTVHNVVLDEVAGRSASIQRFLERLIVSRVDRVIAVSPEIADHLGRGTFIIPASPEPVPSESPASVRERYGIPDEALLVVVTARLHPQKDLPLFFRAWARRADRSAHALIVGDGPDRASLEALRTELDLDTLQLVGASPFAVNEINAADLVVMSSRWEGAPLVIAESMQLGKPIVSTRVGVVPDMLGAGGEIVEVGDEDALVTAIDRYLADADLRARASVVAAERGRVTYGSQRLTETVRQVYLEVLPT